MRASGLLCKIFLHYLNRLAEWGGLISLWCQILDVMERYMTTGDNDSLVSNNFRVFHAIILLQNNNNNFSF
jgi:brefeldin A-resistance guanine nucleotide exchange factor 1